MRVGAFFTKKRHDIRLADSSLTPPSAARERVFSVPSLKPSCASCTSWLIQCAWPSAAQSHRPQFPGFPEQLGGAVSGSPPVAAKTDSSFFIRREPECGQFGALDSLLERIRSSLVLRHFPQVYSKRGIGGGR